MTQLAVRSLRNCEYTVELTGWCHDLAFNGPHPAEPLKRFAIAHYQIAQGIEWDNTIVPDFEAYAAAAIHFTVVAEKLQLGIEPYFPAKLEDLPTEPIDWKQLCYTLSKAQQHVVYAGHPKRIQRGSRYHPGLLTKLLGELVETMLGAIPASQRSRWLESASEIMIGAL